MFSEPKIVEFLIDREKEWTRTGVYGERAVMSYNMKDEGGHTPLDIAILSYIPGSKRIEIIELFLRLKSDDLTAVSSELN